MLYRARATEALLNVTAFCLIALVIAAIDDDVRRHLSNVLVGDRTAELAMIAAPANRLTRVVFETLGDYQAANGSLLAFGAIALVLLGFMFKS